MTLSHRIGNNRWCQLVNRRQRKLWTNGRSRRLFWNRQNFCLLGRSICRATFAADPLARSAGEMSFPPQWFCSHAFSSWRLTQKKVEARSVTGSIENGVGVLGFKKLCPYLMSQWWDAYQAGCWPYRLFATLCGNSSIAFCLPQCGWEEHNPYEAS